MNRFDKIFGGIIFGFIIPIISTCIFWWGGFLFDLNVKLWAIVGIAAGIILDILFLRKLVRKFYDLSIFTILMLYIAYSIGIFGFFMGVPIFNAFLGAIAGLYIGRKMKITKQPGNIYKQEIKKVSLFSSTVLFVICFCSAYIAVTDPYTGANLKGMLNLNFEVTNTSIWLVIILGGIGLLALQYLLLLKAGKIAYEDIC